jgi:molecular chaperone DnaK (HSP70)
LSPKDAVVFSKRFIGRSNVSDEVQETPVLYQLQSLEASNASRLGTSFNLNDQTQQVYLEQIVAALLKYFAQYAHDDSVW